MDFRIFLTIGLCLAAGFIGSFFTDPSWYQEIERPSWSPPSFVFGPVWTILYILMGISLYLVLGEKTAMIAFGIQLILNGLWSIIFFGMRQILLAFAEIVLLWIAILATIYIFYKISKPAAYLLIPYLLWVTFAAALNLSIYMINGPTA